MRPYNNFSDFELQILSTKVCLIHYNARPHASARTQQELVRLKWEIFGYPPYCPDLIPRNFHLFPKLKDYLGGKQFVIDEELKQAVTARLKVVVVEEYNMVVEKLVATEHC